MRGDFADRASDIDVTIASMDRLEIEIPHDLRDRLEARAAELGFARVEEYVESLIRDDIEIPVSDELEAELRKSMETPGREITPAEWARKRRSIVERFGPAKAG